MPFLSLRWWLVINLWKTAFLDIKSYSSKGISWDDVWTVSDWHDQIASMIGDRYIVRKYRFSKKVRSYTNRLNRKREYHFRISNYFTVEPISERFFWIDHGRLNLKNDNRYRKFIKLYWEPYFEKPSGIFLSFMKCLFCWNNHFFFSWNKWVTVIVQQCASKLTSIRFSCSTYYIVYRIHIHI